MMVALIMQNYEQIFFLESMVALCFSILFIATIGKLEILQL
jgi:hypothetical protein